MLTAIVVFLASASVAPQARGGHVVGFVTDESGTALPGVRVSVGDGNVRPDAVTGPDGRFDLANVPPGTYTMTGEIPGFESGSRPVTITTTNGTVEISLVLRPAALCEVQHVGLPFRDAVVDSAAIVQARIIGVEPTPADGRCPSNAVTYTATVIETLKARDVDTRGSMIRWVEDKHEREPEAGHDYIVFLNWDVPHSRYDAGDGLYVFSIEGDRVKSPYDYLPDINGNTVDHVTGLIRAALRNRR